MTMHYWPRWLSAAILLALTAGFGQAATLNIVAVGASNTWGWGVGPRYAYPAQLQRILRRRGIDANVTNAGIVANTTAGMLSRLSKDVPNGTDIVVLQPGTNDRRFGVTEEQRAANIAEIVRRLRRRDINVIVYDPPIPPAYLQFDGIHFTIAAHAKIAATIAAKILRDKKDVCRTC
jgi:acyl-CoA thioesterase-1